MTIITLSYCVNVPFAYVGSRTTGNGGGRFLLAGPRWKGEKPAGVKSVIRSETDFVLVGYRTQLFGPGLTLDSAYKNFRTGPSNDLRRR
jgi:hypothetical protein